MNTFERILDLYQAGARQEHECTCGPASIILAVKSLGLPGMPESAWCDPRFARWLPVGEFLKRGMALQELQLTTELLYPQTLAVELRRAFPEIKARFLEDLELAASSSSIALVVNYLQSDFVPDVSQSNGNPHHSVVAGWDRAGGIVLLADVDAAVTKPYRVPVEKLHASMGTINPAFGIPRGWLLLRRR